MKKLLGAILILIALSGCDGKSSKNENPTYSAIDDKISEIIKVVNKKYADDKRGAGIKVDTAIIDFSSDVLNYQNGILKSPENCTKEAIVKSQSTEYKPIKEEQMKIIDAYVSLVCENGVINEAKKVALEKYAENKFKEAFIEK